MHCNLKRHGGSVQEQEQQRQQQQQHHNLSVSGTALQPQQATLSHGSL
jgi:hypothetical protein